MAWGASSSARATEKAGPGEMLAHLPAYYAGGVAVPRLIGPLLPELCDALYERVIARFDPLPCGKRYGLP